MIKKLLISALFSISLYSSDIKDKTEQAHLSNINAIMIFTSQKAVSSGRYNFTNMGLSADIYTLPFSYNFESSTDFNYFISGSIGYSQVSIMQADLFVKDNMSDMLDYTNHLNTYIIGLGGGLRYKVADKFHVLGGMELLYSRSGITTTKEKDDVTAPVSEFFNKNYNQNLTYKFFSEIEYRPVINKFKPYATLSFRYYETKSNFTFDELSTFRSQSNITAFELGVETPPLIYIGENYFTLEGYVTGNYLKGEIENSTGIQGYITTGGELYFYTPSKPLYARRFYIGASSINASGLEGFNIGAGLSVGF